jgi:hypothetical protein
MIQLRVKILSVFILLSPGSILAQYQFEKIFNYNLFSETNSMATDGDGNVLIYGQHNNSGLILSKISPLGQLLWTKNYDSPADDGLYHLSVAANGNRYAMCGFSMGATTNSRDGIVIITNEDGEILQSIRVDDGGGSNAFHSVAPDGDGWILAGRSDGGPGESYDMALARIDQDGQLEFFKTFGGPDWDWAYSATPAQDGYLLAGYSDGWLLVGGVPYIVRTDANGDAIWSKVIPTTSPSDAMYAVADDEGNFYVSGYTLMTAGLPGQGPNGFIVKLDSEGEVVWFKMVGGVTEIPSMYLAENGDIWAVGTVSNLQGIDFVVFSFDADGTPIQQWKYGGSPAADFGLQITPSLGGGAWILGSTSSFGSINTAYLLRTDQNFQTGCSETAAVLTFADLDLSSVTPAYLEGSGGTSFPWTFTTASETYPEVMVCCQPTAVASFNSEINSEGNIVLTNTSMFYITSEWFIDDVSYGTSETLTYTPESGTASVEICLKVFDAVCDPEIICENINLTSVKNQEAQIKVVIYPNPAKEILNIRSKQGIERVTISDTRGRILSTYLVPSSSTFTVNVDFLQEGLYFLTLYHSDKVASTRFVKQ